MTTYDLGHDRLSSDADGFAAALAASHAARRRPRCVCVPGGVEMYVARLRDGFIIKRMPGTGSRHAPHCPSYEPPTEMSGLGQVLGSAIRQDPATGETTLRLGFSMSKLGARLTNPGPGVPSHSVASDGSRLSLRGLLHYLWDQAELTRWHPGFAGKRTWAIVRRHLLLAAEGKAATGTPLRTRLYVPEAFAVEQREALNARRIKQWRQGVAAPGGARQLLLLIGEVKEISPARYGYKAVVKHVPDQAFAIDEPMYRRLGRQFEAELSLWGSSADLRLIAIATFMVNDAGLPSICEMSLMLVTTEWIPVEDTFERQLVDRLVVERRSFIKGLRHNLHPGQPLAAAALTDSDDSAQLLFIALPGTAHRALATIADEFPTADRWIWDAGSEEMPQLPRRAPSH